MSIRLPHAAGRLLAAGLVALSPDVDAQRPDASGVPTVATAGIRGHAVALLGEAGGDPLRIRRAATMTYVGKRLDPNVPSHVAIFDDRSGAHISDAWKADIIRLFAGASGMPLGAVRRDARTQMLEFDCEATPTKDADRERVLPNPYQINVRYHADFQAVTIAVVFASDTDAKSAGQRATLNAVIAAVRKSIPAQLDSKDPSGLVVEDPLVHGWGTHAVTIEFRVGRAAKR